MSKRSWTRGLAMAVAISSAILGATVVCATETNDPPRLGFLGTLVDLGPNAIIPAPDDIPNRGMQVDTIQQDSPAARMGLEKGDIVISVDSMRFSTHEGYYQAMRCSGQQPSFIVLNARSGNLVRKSIKLPHHQPRDEECGPRPPDSYLMAIDLEADMRE